MISYGVWLALERPTCDAYELDSSFMTFGVTNCRAFPSVDASLKLLPGSKVILLKSSSWRAVDKNG